MRNQWWAAPVLAGGVALLAACGSSSSTAPSTGGSSSPAASSSTTPPATSSGGAVIKTASTSKGTVLVDAAGKTIYWFAIDTPTKSNCNAGCASFWPPVIGNPSAAAGASLPKAFGTITRSDGKMQATYDGHPLYTFTGDTGPGQIKGNGYNASGGLWWAMTPSGAKLGASPSPKTTTSSGGGGYY